MLSCSSSSVVDCKIVSLSEIDFSDCEELTVWHYNPSSHSFVDFPDARYIKTLRVYHSNITDFSGMDRFPYLRALEMAYCPKLFSFCGFPDKLTFLMIEHARKLTHYEALGGRKTIETLRLFECGDIADLSFIAEMPALREFRLFNTNVADGDLQPLLDHVPRLETVVFNNKRHYSHTEKQIQEELQKRGADG
ncbi:MAG: hypothetical protein ACI4RK_01530, partial [Oscillospiraceae bacterium]